ncbi:Hypothetical protein BAOM_1390 [Peribacillus asahii]|uniref:DUF2726 domain-containing protein n=1 Tax=Peribacillus asahii TaxID=228899 RepID=A0A3T0KNK8_9BACI|nr:hypothetical protein [Peribacillus asahii]AZV42000.1 Hypothetical protein BAOM_1390 [Peribacillus asahii]
MTKRRTHEEFVEKVNNLCNGEYIVLDEVKYKTARIDVWFKHMEESCDFHVFPATPDNFMKKSRKIKCPLCSKRFQNNKLRKGYDKLDKEVFEIVGDEYELLRDRVKYKNADTNVWFKHRNETCGFHEFLMKPKVFTSQNGRCPKCADAMRAEKKRKEVSQILKEVYDLVSDEYEVLLDRIKYKNTTTDIMFRHNNKSCNFHEFPMRLNNFIQGEQRCPRCNEKKGERRTRVFLEKNNVNYIHNYRFKDCRGKRNPLPFDFAIFDNDLNLKHLVEVDGEQHEKAIDFFGGEEKFLERQLYDTTKDDYAKRKEIPLTRIKYQQFDELESILEMIINSSVLLPQHVK